MNIKNIKITPPRRNTHTKGVYQERKCWWEWEWAGLRGRASAPEASGNWVLTLISGWDQVLVFVSNTWTSLCHPQNICSSWNRSQQLGAPWLKHQHTPLICTGEVTGSVATVVHATPHSCPQAHSVLLPASRTATPSLSGFSLPQLYETEWTFIFWDLFQNLSLL